MYLCEKIAAMEHVLEGIQRQDYILQINERQNKNLNVIISFSFCFQVTFELFVSKLYMGKPIWTSTTANTLVQIIYTMESLRESPGQLRATLLNELYDTENPLYISHFRPRRCDHNSNSNVV